MFRKLLGFILLLVLVRWKWDALKALVLRYIDADWFYGFCSTRTEAPATKSVPTDHASEEKTVYVTASGTRYHRTGCRSLTPDAQAMSLEEAKQQYRSCGRCHPPE